MTAVIIILIGAALGFWLERSDQRAGAIKQITVFSGLFVAGMLIEAAAGGTLIQAVIEPGDLQFDQLLSLPLAMVIVVWMFGMLGMLAGAGGWLVYQRLRKPRPA